MPVRGAPAPRRKPGRADRPPPDNRCCIFREPHRPRAVRSGRDGPHGGGPALWARRARREACGSGLADPHDLAWDGSCWSPCPRSAMRFSGSIPKVAWPGGGAPGNRRLPAPEWRGRPRGRVLVTAFGRFARHREWAVGPRRARASFSTRSPTPSSQRALARLTPRGSRRPAPLQLGAPSSCSRREAGLSVGSGSAVDARIAVAGDHVYVGESAPRGEEGSPTVACCGERSVLLDRVELPVRKVYDLLGLPRGATRRLGPPPAQRPMPALAPSDLMPPYQDDCAASAGPAHRRPLHGDDLGRTRSRQLRPTRSRSPRAGRARPAASGPRFRAP